MSEEKSGLFGKIENIFHRKPSVDDRVLRASYRAGRNKAEHDYGFSGGNYQADEDAIFGSHSRKGSIAHTYSRKNSHSTKGYSRKNSAANGHITKIGNPYPIGSSAAAGTVAGEQEPGYYGHPSGAQYGQPNPQYGHQRSNSASHQRSHSGSHGPHEIAANSKGAILTVPPTVNRQPLEQTYGGDFTDGKTPTQLAGDYGNERGELNTDYVISNDNPRYGNEAHPVSGRGEFYDPQDTQAGYYSNGYHGSPHEKHSDHHSKPVGAAAAAGAAGLAGGVAVAHKGTKYPDATEAELHQRNLKTQPSLYAQQEEERKRLEDILVRAYNAGRQKGRRESESKNQYNPSATSQNKSLDPQAEHSKNKSTYNQGGLVAAEEEAKGHHPSSGTNQSSYVPGTKSGDSRSKPNSHGSNHTKTHGTDASDSGSGSGLGYGAAGAAAGAHAAHDKHSQKPTHDTSASHQPNASDVNAGTPASDPNFDYEKEMKRLDQSIDQTQREINALSAADPNVTAPHGHATSQNPTGTSGYNTSAPQDNSHSDSNKGILGAAAAAVGLGGAGYAAHESKPHDASNKAYNAGYNQGSQKHEGSNAHDVNSNAYNAGYAQGSGPSHHGPTAGKSSYSASANNGPPIAAVSQGKAMESQSPSEDISSYHTTDPYKTTDPAYKAKFNKADTHTDSTANPGLFGGAAGAAAAVGSVAASAIGYGDKSDDHHSLDKNLEKKTYDAGYSSGTAHSPSGNSHKSSSSETFGNPYTTTPKSEDKNSNQGILAAGAAALGLGGVSTAASTSGKHPETSTGEPLGVDHSRAVAPATSGSHPETATGEPFSAKHSGSKATAPTTSGSHPETATGEPIGRSSGATTEHSEENHGYLDSAKEAIAAAGVAAAGAFGYEGYNQYYHGENDQPATAAYSSKADKSRTPSKAVAEDNSVPHSAVKPSTRGVEDQNYGKSQDVVSPSDAGKSNPNTSEGLLGKLGFGGSSSSTDTSSQTLGLGSAVAGAVTGAAGAVGLNSATKNRDTNKDSEYTRDPSRQATSNHQNSGSSGSNSGVGSSFAGAVSSAAGAVGLSNRGAAHNNVDSLVEEAAAEYDDVSKEPRHKSKGGVLEQSKDADNANTPTVGGIKLDEDQGDKKEAKAIDNTQLEKHLAAHNKKHGHVNEKRNLVEVAEDAHPEIKKFGLAAGAAAGAAGAAIGAAGLKDSHKQQDSGAHRSDYKSAQSPKAGFGAHGRRDSDAVNSSTPRTPNFDGDLEKRLYNAGYDAGNTSPKSSAYNDVERRAYEAGQRHGHQEHKRSLAAGTAAGAGVGAAGAGIGSEASSRDKHSHSRSGSASHPIVEVIGIADRAEAQKIAQRTTRKLSLRGEDLSGGKIVIDTNKGEIYKSGPEGVETYDHGHNHSPRSPNSPQSPETPQSHAAYSPQSSHTSHGSNTPYSNTKGVLAGAGAGAAAGAGLGAYGHGHGHGHSHGQEQYDPRSFSRRKTQPDASFSEELEEEDGSAFHDQHQKVKNVLDREAEKGHLGNVNGGEEPLHISRGVSQPDSSAAHGTSTGTGGLGAGFAGVSAGAAGAAGAVALHGGHSTTQTQPDASFHDRVNDIDGASNHLGHQKVKSELEHEATKGHLGNVPNNAHARGTTYDQDPSRNLAGAYVPGSSGAGDSRIQHSTGYGQTAERTQPDASFNDKPSEVDGSQYHQQHEKVKQMLENEAHKRHLGNIVEHEDSRNSRSGVAAGALAGGALGAGVGGLVSSHGTSGHDNSIPHGISADRSIPSGTVRNSSVGDRTQPDASFKDHPTHTDGSWSHQQHHQAKEALEDKSRAGTVGAIPASYNPTHHRKVSDNDPLAAPTQGSSSHVHGKPKAHEHTHSSSKHGSEVFTSVAVVGEPDDTRAEALAQDAVTSLTGRKDIPNSTELRIDARSGSITDQNGQFIGQLSQRKLSQTDEVFRPTGGIVSPPNEPSHGSHGARTAYRGLGESKLGSTHGANDKFDAGAFTNRVSEGLHGTNTQSHGGASYATSAPYKSGSHGTTGTNTSGGLATGGSHNHGSHSARGGHMEKMPGSFF